MAKYITIRTREEYAKLQHLPFNRNYAYRVDLAKSINQWAWFGVILLIKTDLITGKWETFIVDGAHRAETASQLGIPFDCQVVEIEFKSIPEIVIFIATVNCSQLPWRIEEYVRVYSYLGYQEYKTLNQLTVSCPFPISTVAAMLYGFRSRGKVGKMIKHGEFCINLLDETKYTINLSARLSKYGQMGTRMVTSLHYVTSQKNFDEDKFTNAYIKNYKCIKEMVLDDYTTVFASWL